MGAPHATPTAGQPGPCPASALAGGYNHPKKTAMTPTEHEQRMLAEMHRLNANLETLLSASQGELLARLVEILADLRQIAASTLGATR